jgi:hypothetical protein
MSMTEDEAIAILAQHLGQDDLFKAWTRMTNVIATRYPREQVEKVVRDSYPAGEP